MILLGLLLILVAATATVIAVIAPTTTSGVVTLTALGLTFSATPIRMFIAGAVSVLLVVLGFALITKGSRRSASSRKELRQLKKQAAAAPPRATNPGDSSTGPARAHDPGTKNTTDTSQ